MTSRLARLALLWTLGGLALGLPLRAATSLLVGHLYSVLSVQHRALLEADRELAAASGGALRLEIKPNGSLGNQDSRLVDAVHFGQSDLVLVGAPFAARDYAPLGVLSAPFVFRDYQHWQHFQASPMAGELAAAYRNASPRTRIAGFYYNGSRHINSRNPVRRPEDLAGLRIRVPNAPLYLELFRALGASPVPWPFLKTYQGLKDGTFDAEENPLTTIEDGRFWAVAPCITLSGHMIDTGVLLMNEGRLDALPQAQRRLVLEVIARLCERLSRRVHEQELEQRSILEKAGVRFFGIDRAALAARTGAMVDSGFPWSGKLYQRLKHLP